MSSSLPRSTRKRAAAFPNEAIVSRSISTKRSTEIEAATTSNVSSTPTAIKPHQDCDLLSDWLHHSHHSYHIDTFLSPARAYAIRLALVNWYRANRRKLPWRGDIGPYDGSTAGFGGAATAGKGDARKKKGGKSEALAKKDIRSYFRGSADQTKVDSDASTGEEKKQEEGVQSADSNVEKGRLLPPEKRDVTAYGVWVSEIMLQQTRVEAVIPYYLKWMQTFPTVQSLANASHDEVNSHWAGLGFYRRARLLHQGAKRVVSDYHGIVPNTVEELMKVEGIGRYTASAIASIAYGVDVPVVDGNVCRVLSRLTGVANHIKAGVLKDDLGWVLAEKIIKAKSGGDGESHTQKDDVIGSPGEVNQGLMELGATYCSPSGSGIEEGDPLKHFYASTQLGVAIGLAMKCDSLVSTQTVAGIHAGKSQCRLCDPDGVSSVFYDVVDRINTSSKTTNLTPQMVSAISGHAAIPMPPPKKAKRQEVLAVGVICLQHTNKNDDCWLMVKRPSDGLLAGQWEFPSVCLWSSGQKDSKAKSSSGKLSADVQVPYIDASVRSTELNSYIRDLFQSTASAANVKKEFSSASKNRVRIDDPIVHIFSHVCHTMWVEYSKLNSNKFDCEIRWKLKDGREAGWFTANDMQSVGITSGVRKVLALVEENQ